MKIIGVLSFIITAAIFIFVFIWINWASAAQAARVESRAKDMKCLALNIFHEARGEPISGQIAVAQVTMNRVAHKNWPNDVCSVVYQYKQFSWTSVISNKIPHESTAWTTAQSIAKTVYTDKEDDFVQGAVFYHADYVEPDWDYSKITMVAKIGTHIFYTLNK